MIVEMLGTIVLAIPVVAVVVVIAVVVAVVVVLVIVEMIRVEIPRLTAGLTVRERRARAVRAVATELKRQIQRSRHLLVEILRFLTRLQLMMKQTIRRLT